MAFRATDLPHRLDAEPGLVLPTLLRRRAETAPDHVFVRTVAGEDVTYHQLEDRIRRWKTELRRLGVGSGDRVMTLLPPSVDAVAVWMAAARLRAVETPVNTALRGRFLAHVVTDGDPRCLITDPDLLPVLDEIADDVALPAVMTPPGATDNPAVGGRAVPAVALDHPDDGDDHHPRPGDVATMVYTSGTSGRSKGVVVPWAQEFATARWLMPVEGREHDVWYGPWAMFHVSGKVGLYSAALLDGRLIIRNGFSTSAFWDDVRRFGVTSTMIVASTVAFLNRRPVSPADRDHSLRHVCAAPLPPDPAAFSARFGVRLSTLFNMTETASPISTGWDDVPAGSCGKLRPGVEARIVDEDGTDVPVGEVGELLLRSSVPHENMAGYWRADAATVEAWRDLWFHTGDGVRADAEGNFYFVDRLKDTIRRGGENISSAELEEAVTHHPLVRECAAVGMDTDWGDREVKLFVVGEPGLDAARLAADLDTRLPRYMRPAAIAILPDLPRTHTARVRKAELRAITDPPDWVRPARATATTGDHR